MIGTSLRRLLLMKIAVLVRSTSSSMRNWCSLLVYLFLIQKYSSLSCSQLSWILKLIAVIMRCSRSWNHLWWLCILMSLLCCTLNSRRLNWCLLSVELLILLSLIVIALSTCRSIHWDHLLNCLRFVIVSCSLSWRLFTYLQLP